MKEAAFCIGMKNGNLTVWSKMYEFYKTTGSDSYREIALRALACIENVQTLTKYYYLNTLLEHNKNTKLEWTLIKKKKKKTMWAHFIQKNL